MSDYPYVYRWKNNEKRKTLYGKFCKIVKQCSKNSVVVQFEDGGKEIVSRYSIQLIIPYKPSKLQGVE